MIDPAVAAVVAGTLALYAYRTDFAKYSIATFGVYKRVTRASVREEGNECRDCETEVERGERRKWYKEIVAFGAVVIRYGGGTAYYCHDHAAFEIRNDLQHVDELPSRTEKGFLFIAKVIVGIDSARPELPSQNKNEFEDAVKPVGSAFDMLGIAMIVLVAAVFLGVLQQIRGVRN